MYGLFAVVQMLMIVPILGSFENKTMDEEKRNKKALSVFNIVNVID